MDLIKTTEFRVGLLAMVVITLIAVMTMRVSEDSSLWGSSKHYWFVIPDAAGIIKNSPVKMAGINVGIIKSISLQDGQARIDMYIRKDLKITQNAKAVIKANGILGDKYVELSPGSGDAAELGDGSQISQVQNIGSIDEVMGEVGKLSKSLSEVAESLKEATTGDGDKNSPLGRIVHNIEVLTGDIAEFTKGNKEKLGSIVDNLNETTSTINELVNDETDEGFRAAWNDAVKSLRRVDRILANVEDVTEKVKKGEGTLGKLINDEETIQEINTAVAGVNQMLGTANKIQTNLDFRSEFLAEQNLVKSYLGVRIQPGLDRYYEIAVVDDPKGVVETTRTQNTVNPGGAGEATTVTEERKTFKNRVKFTALFAKNFYDFTVKGGLIENTGGVGFDYHVWRRRFRLSLEVFDIQENSVHMRGSLKYSFVRGLYLIGGADDFASRRGTYSSYLGAGLDLTNDDLKALLGRVSF